MYFVFYCYSSLIRTFLRTGGNFTGKETPSATAGSLKETSSFEGIIGSLVATGSMIAAVSTVSVGGTCLFVHTCRCFIIWTFLMTVFEQ